MDIGKTRDVDLPIDRSVVRGNYLGYGLWVLKDGIANREGWRGIGFVRVGALVTQCINAAHHVVIGSAIAYTGIRVGGAIGCADLDVTTALHRTAINIIAGRVGISGPA